MLYNESVRSEIELIFKLQYPHVLLVVQSSLANYVGIGLS
jgi:hypothetical protein